MENIETKTTTNAEVKAETQEGEIGFAMLVRGTLEDKPFWAYVSIRPDKFEEFLEVEKSGEAYHLPDYGDIIEYKIGEKEPQDDIKAMMEEKYGISHDFEDMMKQVAEDVFPPLQKLEGP